VELMQWSEQRWAANSRASICSHWINLSCHAGEGRLSEG